MNSQSSKNALKILGSGTGFKIGALHIKFSRFGGGDSGDGTQRETGAVGVGVAHEIERYVRRRFVTHTWVGSRDETRGRGEGKEDSNLSDYRVLFHHASIFRVSDRSGLPILRRSVPPIFP